MSHYDDDVDDGDDSDVEDEVYFDDGSHEQEMI